MNSTKLDIYYVCLYGLTRDELRYILDPKEVHWEDFPGETFRVLKKKEVRLYGEYWTRRLVLGLIVDSSRIKKALNQESNIYLSYTIEIL